MNTWPDIGLFSNLVCTKALSPWKPRRRSVTPAAIQICVWLGRVIIAVGTLTTHAIKSDRYCLPGVLARAAVGCESCLTRRTVSTQQVHGTNRPAAQNSRQQLAPATVWPSAPGPVAPPDTAGTS